MMHFEIGFSDFRGFHQQSPVPIRPLTILVGENSAGKSSFLAGLKYTADFLNTGGNPSFNGDPFQLGTFEQIAHNRGGRAGRAKEFRIRLSKPFTLVMDGKVQKGIVEMNLAFGRTESNAALKSVDLKVDRASVRATIDAQDIRWEFRDSRNQTVNLKELMPYGSFRGMDGERFMSYAIRDLQYALHRRRSRREEEPDISPEMERFSEFLGKFIGSFRNEAHASSAIRFKPLRTYTPGIEAEDGEGSHVPFEMAKLARRRDKSEWKAMQQQLVSFGSASNMFQEIDVKSFGLTASDPFQVQLSSSGPKMNLVDLGYGTSQVLPIIFNSSKRGGNIDFLIQQPEVHLHPRAQAALGQFFVDAFLQKKQSFVLETHSDFIVDRIRLAVAQELIDKDDVSILFFERHRLENKVHPIKIGADGEPVNPPRSYREFFLGEQMKVLGL